MSPLYPITFEWNGEVMVPLNKRLANKQYVVGEYYRLEAREERSTVSHDHFFACVQETWKNLPEDMAEHYPTPDHLRKRALIKCGYRNERSIVCASAEEARKVAAFIQPFDDMAYIVIRDNVVTVYTAESQSLQSQDKERFQASKNAVLDLLSTMIGVSVETLKSNAGQAA